MEVACRRGQANHDEQNASLNSESDHFAGRGGLRFLHCTMMERRSTTPRLSNGSPRKLHSTHGTRADYQRYHVSARLFERRKGGSCKIYLSKGGQGGGATKPVPQVKGFLIITHRNYLITSSTSYEMENFKIPPSTQPGPRTNVDVYLAREQATAWAPMTSSRRRRTELRRCVFVLVFANLRRVTQTGR